MNLRIKPFQVLKKFAVANTPEILTGIGIAGAIVTVVSAVKATPKALRLIEEMKAEKENPKPVDVVKASWKCYIPTALTGGASIACIIFAARKQSRRNAALAAAYAFSEQTFSEYKQKVVEKFGKKKEEEVRDEISEDHRKKSPVVNKEVILTGSGDVLCYDIYRDKYFKSSIEKLRKIENTLNYRIIHEMFVSLNEFYYEIQIPPLKKKGDLLGWNIDKGYVELHFTYGSSEDGTPCLMISYDPVPYYGYM